jgi:hypothetical protein
MKDNNAANFWQSVANSLTVVLGTAAKEAIAVERHLLNGRGNGQDLFGPYIFFDWQAAAPADLGALLGAGPEEMFAPDNFVQAVLPLDFESRQKAEDEGKLISLPGDWHRDPRATQDNIGASGDPNIGLALFRINQGVLRRKIDRKLQWIADHDRQGRLALEGMDVAGMPARVMLLGVLSAVGGMGGGSAYAFSEMVRRSAEDLGIQAKVVLHVLLRGNLPIQDRERADMNQMSLLKFLRAATSGKHVDPVTGGITRCPFDGLFLESNANRHGNLPALERLLVHEGHCLDQLLHSSAGVKIRERLADLENWEFDEYGDPQAAMTVSVAHISRDSARVLAYCTQSAGAIFADGLRTPGETDKARKHALGLARVNEMVETEDENQVTSRILHPAEFGGDSVLERARADVADRVGTSGGLARAIAMADALAAVRNGDAQGTFEPTMRKQAQVRFKEVKTSLDGEFDRCMQILGGIHEAREIMTVLRKVADLSRGVIMAKIRHTQEVAKPHEEVIAEALEKLERLRKGGFWGRLLHPFLPGWIALALETSGRVALDCQLEISACVIAVQEFLVPLLECLDRRLAWLTNMDRKLQDVAAQCRQEADHWSRKPTAMTAPLGYELATPEYLANWFNARVGEKGGTGKVIEELLALYMTRHGSLSPLAEMSIEEVREAFAALAQELFQPAIDRTDAVREFQRLYPDKATQQRLLAECVRQSEGRLPTFGVGDREIVWIKVLTVPAAEYTEWAAKIVESVDRKSGHWEVVVDANSDRMTIIQLRGGVSLTPLIARLDRLDIKDWPQVVSHAPDPFSALGVGPNPDRRELRRVIAKAIVVGLLGHDPEAGFTLRSTDGQDIALGRQPQVAMDALRKRWPDLVYIESMFGRHLVVAEQEVIAQLRRLGTELAAGPTADLRLGLIDQTAVAEAAWQVEILLPWARRVGKFAITTQP